MKMALLTTILIAVLSWYRCEVTGVEGGVSTVPEVANAAEALSLPFYIDLRAKVDHLGDKIGDIREKMASLDSRVDTKIENLGLKLSLEIRDQLAMFMRDIKTHLVSEGAREVIRYKDEQQHLYQSSSDLVANITKTDGAVGELQGEPAYSWITILRRVDGRVNFTRGWDDYKAGFGDLGTEFWLGLEDIHQLTAVRSYRLRVVLTDFSGEVKFAEYSQFYIRGEAEKYRLHVSGYVTGSTAGDSMKTHNNMDFSTFDKDNDKYGSNCALKYKGGWWYSACHSVNPTGLYLGAGTIDALGLNWFAAYKDRRSFKRLEMSIRLE